VPAPDLEHAVVGLDVPPIDDRPQPLAHCGGVSRGRALSHDSAGVRLTLTRMATGGRTRPSPGTSPGGVREGDPIHRLGIARLTPDERLAQGFAWIEFANRLRGSALRKDGEWPRPTRSADDTISTPSR
jgi:hypothetical protein